MNYSSIQSKYITLLEKQKEIIAETERRVLSTPPDTLIVDNLNYFVKAYLVNICTYLEAYKQDLAVAYCNELAERIKAAKVPKNIVIWNVKEKTKDSEFSFEDFCIDTSKEKISDELSGNPYKAIALYKKLGVNLESNSDFTKTKDIVFSYVSKRNKIIHYNDDASDISFSDLLSFIEEAKHYMGSIKHCLEAQYN